MGGWYNVTETAQDTLLDASNIDLVGGIWQNSENSETENESQPITINCSTGKNENAAMRKEIDKLSF